MSSDWTYSLLALVHLLSLVALVGVTIAVVWRNRYRRVTWANIIGGLIMFGIVTGMTLCAIALYPSYLLPPDVCPTSRWFVPALGSGLIVIFTSGLKGWKAMMLCALVMISGPLLSLHFLSLMDSHRHPPFVSHFTSNPELTARASRDRPARYTMKVQELLKHPAEHTNQSFPAGWLAESPLIQALPRSTNTEVVRRCTVYEDRPVTLWHSWFSSIYAVQHPTTLGIWYPGGLLSEAPSKLEWRRR